MIVPLTADAGSFLQPVLHWIALRAGTGSVNRRQSLQNSQAVVQLACSDGSRQLLSNSALAEDIYPASSWTSVHAWTCLAAPEATLQGAAISAAVLQSLLRADQGWCTAGGQPSLAEAQG